MRTIQRDNDNELARACNDRLDSGIQDLAEERQRRRFEKLEESTVI